MFYHPKYYKEMRAERRKLQAASFKHQAPSFKQFRMILINNHNLNTIKMYKLVWLIGVLPGQAENTATQKEIS